MYILAVIAVLLEFKVGLERLNKYFYFIIRIKKQVLKYDKYKSKLHNYTELEIFQDIYTSVLISLSLKNKDYVYCLGVSGLNDIAHQSILKYNIESGQSSVLENTLPAWAKTGRGGFYSGKNIYIFGWNVDADSQGTGIALFNPVTNTVTSIEVPNFSNL